MSHEIALDLDSTLAATCVTAFDLLNETGYSYDDIESWTWGFDEFGKARYLNSMWHAWSLRPLDVPFMEPQVPEAVDQLHDVADRVDVVTAHPDHLMGVSEGKQEWLDTHGIEYDDFITVDGGKETLGYDVYIDDKPTLPESVNETNPEANVFLRDHPYNRDAGGEYIRVNSLREVAARLAEPVEQ